MRLIQKIGSWFDQRLQLGAPIRETMQMNYARVVCLLVASVFAQLTVAQAQTTYHLHNEASSTSGLKQLKTAGPDVTSVALPGADCVGNVGIP